MFLEIRSKRDMQTFIKHVRCDYTVHTTQQSTVHEADRPPARTV